jgi:hypothetical protein
VCGVRCAVCVVDSVIIWIVLRCNFSKLRRLSIFSTIDFLNVLIRTPRRGFQCGLRCNAVRSTFGVALGRGGSPVLQAELHGERGHHGCSGG